MGAGGSIHKKKTELIYGSEEKPPVDRKLQTHHYSLTSLPGRGVGIVQGIEKSLLPSSLVSPRDNFKGVQYGWFVESIQSSGEWENYNEESSSRLEDAFLSHDNSCLVIHKNRTYTVDLVQMIQLTAGAGPSGVGESGTSSAHRRVKRAPCEVVVDPASGRSVSKQMVQRTEGFLEDDPFFIDEKGDSDEDLMSDKKQSDKDHSTEESAATATGLQKSTRPHDGRLPTLVQSIIPGDGQTTFTMTISPQSLKATPANGHGDEGKTNNGLIVVTGGKKGFLRSLNVSTAEWLCDYEVHHEPTILHTVYSPRGEYIAAGTDDFKAYIFRDGISTPRHELRGHTGKVYGLSFTSSGSKLVTSSMDSTIRIWDIESGCCTQHQSVQESYVFFIQCSEHNSHLAISGGNDNLLTIHDFRTPTTVAMRCPGHESTLWYGAIQPHSDVQFASCGKDCTVRLWDVRKGSQALFVLRNHARQVHCVEYSPCGSYLLSSGRDGRVIGALSRTGESQWTAKASLSTVFRVFFASEQKKMFTCASSAVSIWDWTPSL